VPAWPASLIGQGGQSRRLWPVNRFIPMQSSIKSILSGVAVIAVVWWFLNLISDWDETGPGSLAERVDCAG
jgi:hypothetical protein